MEIILKNTYQPLGQKGDIVVVKPGYARNYLIPKGIAEVANKSNKKIVLERTRQAINKALRIKENAQNLLPILAGCKITIAAKVGKEGKIFGSVTPLQIAKSLKEKGIVLDYTQIHLADAIKTLGTHEANLMLHEEVQYTLSFEVVAS